MRPPAFITQGNRRNARALGHGRFPHMSPADTEVWLALLGNDHPTFDWISYDTRLGEGSRVYGLPERHHAEGWRDLSLKRVDAVVGTAGAVFATEVKPIASMSALGQSLAYAFLLDSEYEFPVPVRPLVVAWVCDHDLAPIFADHGVSVLLPAAPHLGRRRLASVAFPLE